MTDSERMSIRPGPLAKAIEAKANEWEVPRATAAVYLIADALELPRPDLSPGNPDAAGQMRRAQKIRWKAKGAGKQ